MYVILRLISGTLILGDLMITTIARTFILYIFVTLGIRLMGKRQIGDMQPNELVITLLISEIAAIPLQDTSQPLIYGVVSLFVLVILEIFMSVIALKSRFIRRIMNGRSMVIIKNGEIDQKAVRDVRMTVTELCEQLRAQNVFDISTVAYAVLEVNGDLSVLLKASEQPPTKKELSIKAEKQDLFLPVITDGKIEKEALKQLKVSTDELKALLKAHKLTYDKVFLMTMDRAHRFNIVKMR